MREEAVQFISSLSVFATMVFIPLIAYDYGATPFQTSLIIVGYNMSVFLSNYACGRGADMYGRRLFLLIGLGSSSAAFAVHILAYDAISLGIIRILGGICVGMWGPALLAYVFEAKKKLGKVMGFGGLGWGTGVFLAGVLAMYWGIFLLSSVFFLVAFAIALGLPRLKEVKHKIPLFPRGVIAKSHPAYLAVVVRHTGATAVWVLLPIYLREDLGLTATIIGYVYASNAFIQFIVMTYADRLPSRVSISIGLVLSVLTFGLFQFGTTAWHWAGLLMSIGTAWGFLYVGATYYVMERNVERATSTGILQGSMSLAGISGPIVGGLLAEVVPYTYNFYFAVALSVLGLFIFLATDRVVTRRMAAVEEEGEEEAVPVEPGPPLYHPPGPGAVH